MEPHKVFSYHPLKLIYNEIEYTERWTKMPGYNNNYLISDFGRIYSIREKMVMRQQLNDRGYLTIGFSVNRSRKKFKVHRLVGLAFIPNPENKPEINHDDFKKTNNFYLNLQWATGKENLEHAQKGGRIPIAVPKEKVGEYPVRYQNIINTQTGFVYESVYHLSNETGISPKEIRRRLSNERPNNTPYLWVKGQYTLVYKKKNQKVKSRFLELRERVYSMNI